MSVEIEAIGPTTVWDLGTQYWLITSGGSSP